MKFARRAKWLTQLFTPSVTPPTHFPSSYSEDVSLISPYDGGGWGIPEPGEWGIAVSAVVQATSQTIILTVGEENIYRLLGLSAFVSAGVAPVASLMVVPLGAAQSIYLSERVTLDANLQAINVYNTRIFGPGAQIIGQHRAGDAATAVHWRMYGVELPLGASPTV